MNENHEKIMSFVLRIGVAFVFVYPSVMAVADPMSWIKYFPAFIVHSIPVMLFGIPSIVLLSKGFAAFELILAVWIVSGKKIFIPSVITSLLLIGIIGFNLDKFGTLFRNVAILSATIALALHSYSAKHIYEKSSVKK